MPVPDWVKNYKTPVEDQWIADPRTGAPVSTVPSSTPTLTPVPVTPKRSTSFPPQTHSLAYRLSFAPVASLQKAPAPDKYATIDSLEQSKKIDALKDIKLNPYALKDPYDTLTHNFYLWTQVARNATANPHLTGEQQKQIASNFYDKMLAPAYGGLKITPMSKELWMQQAYTSALDYKIEDAYQNNFIHDLKTGANAGLAATARAYGRATDMLGNVVDDAVELWRSGKYKQVLSGAAAERPSWLHIMQDINTQVKAKRAKEQPSAVERGAIIQGANRQFWADVLPTQHGFWNNATSMVAEGVGQAPIFAALDEVAAPARTLTEALNTGGPLAKKAAGWLISGSEGLAFGAAAHKQDDPGEAWRDAIGFAAFNALFDVAGLGVKKLVDVAPASWSKKLSSYEQKLEMAQNGQRPATPAEQYEMHQKEVANNIVATGVLGQRAIYVDALHHVEEMENIAPEQVRASETALLEKDPARYAPVLSAARFIRSLLGEKKLSEIKPGSEEEKYLSERLAQLIVDSSDKIGTAAKGMDEVHVAKATKVLGKAKHTLEYYRAQATKELAKSPGAAGMISPEQVDKYAAKLYTEDMEKATAEAEKKLAEKPVEKATNAAKRRKDKPVPGMKIRSERTVNKYGEPAARYQIVPDYKVRLKAHMAAAKAKGVSLTRYFEDLDDQDFVNDLNAFFYPKELRSAKVFFENQKTREGIQNPNFLAFMYNYLHQMPAEFGKELENRLIDTVKVQQYMKGKAPTEPQLLYYAKAMYNHVDNFLGSGRWPQESNLFRSSNETMFNTTEWQRQLLLEKQVQEQANLKDMFSGDKKALRTALTTHSAFSKLRLSEFDKASTKRGSQDIIRGYDELIADLQVPGKRAESSKFSYKRWKF